MRKYSQKKQNSPLGFVYEYWWARQPHMYGYRMMKVRLPSTIGPCRDWPISYNMLEGREDAPIDLTDFENWDWIIYIPEPEFSEELKCF